jgi:hypothetical protein
MNPDAGPLKLLADRAPMNAQLGTDPAQRPALGVQVGCAINVHGGHRNQSLSLKAQEAAVDLGTDGTPRNRPNQCETSGAS